MTRFIVFGTLILLIVACAPPIPEIVPIVTVRPSVTPTLELEPTIHPTDTAEPTIEPTSMITPTAEPTIEPTSMITPTAEPTIEPTRMITPTAEPTATPTQLPTPVPNPLLNFWYLIDGEIYRYNFGSGTSEHFPVTKVGSVQKARISSSGQWLAFIDEEGLKYLSPGTGEIYTVTTLPFTNAYSQLVFSPDERLLAYTDSNGLKTLDLETNTSRLLWVNEYGTESLSSTTYYPIAWSADQEWLTVQAAQFENGWLSVGSVSTGEIFRIMACNDADVDWSPEGAKLAMTVNFYLFCASDGEDGLYTVEMTAEGIDEQMVQSEFFEALVMGENMLLEAVRWSPDGTRILFAYNDYVSNVGQLFIYPLDGSGVQSLGDAENTLIRNPLWTADGAYIFFGDEKDGYTIYELNLASQEKRSVYFNENFFQIRSLSPDENWVYISGFYRDPVQVPKLVNVVSGTAVEIESGDEVGWTITEPQG